MTVIDRARSAATSPPRRGRVGPTSGDDTVGGDPSRWRQLRPAFADRLWPSALVLGALATVSTLTSGGGRYVGDNRFEIYVNPARRAARSVVLWDGSRGLGRVREDLWPVQSLVPGFFRACGASYIVAELLFHAFVLGLLGLGIVQFLRLFRPQIGPEHLLAAVMAMFGPYTAAFLVPSNLYLYVALSPWLLVCAYRGVHDHRRRWRWAAGFALLTFVPGNADLPGLVYNVAPLAPLLLYVVAVDRSARVRDCLGWLARAGTLTVWVSMATLTKTYYAAGALGQRLNDTEAAEAAALTSSWAESFRGFGNWLSYFPLDEGLLKPQNEPYVADTWIILATFVPPVLALVTFAWLRWRPRILLALLAVTSLVVMVGAFPLGDSPPAGGAMLSLLRDIRSLAAFRNTYKIGSGYLLGLVPLAAIGVVTGLRALRERHPRLSVVGAVAAAAVVASAATPFWTGGVYNEDQMSPTVPRYWTEAMAWLDSQPGGGRVMVLPQGSRLGYRWGWVGDDLFDAMLARDHAISTGVPLSTPMGASMLEALSQTAFDPLYEVGSMAPVARRLGIDTVVLRNDVDWRQLEQPRPAQYQGLRNDPDWERVATFGDVGQYTTSREDISAAAQYERTLPPVEVYALRGGAASLRLDEPAAATLVSGDGYAWPAMASLGLLDDGRSALPTGAVPTEVVHDELEAGSPVVVTDTNRRRLRVLVGFEPDYSHTLTEGQHLDRPTQSLFGTAESQSVAWFPDAAAITVTGSPRSLGGSTPWTRPAMAFDGNPLTAWQVARLDVVVGRRLRVTLREPTALSTMRLVPTRPTGEPSIVSARLRFSDGSTVDVDTSDGTAVANFPARLAEWFEVEVIAVDNDVEVAGFSDITVPGLDLREHVQAPDDVFRRGDADEATRALLDRAHISYLFQRSQLPGQPDEETTIRRRFRSSGTRTFAVDGVARARPTTSDRDIAAIVGGDVQAQSARRLDANLAAWAGYAIDGDLATGWQGPPVAGNTIRITMPEREVSSVRILSRAEFGYTPIEEVDVQVGDESVSVALQILDGCDPMSATANCVYEGVAELPSPATVDEVSVAVGEVGGPSASLGGKVRIDEIEFDGVPNEPAVDLDAPFEDCIDLGLVVEDAPGSLTGIEVRLDGSPGQFLAGEALRFTGCEEVELTNGWHRLAFAENAPVNRVALRTTDVSAPSAVQASQQVTAVAADPTSRQVDLALARDGGVLVMAQSWDPRWRATADGTALGRSLPYDGLNGWRIEGEGDLRVSLRYPPQRVFRVALGLTVAGLAVCGWLLVRRPGVRHG